MDVAKAGIVQKMPVWKIIAGTVRENRAFPQGDFILQGDTSISIEQHRIHKNSFYLLARLQSTGPLHGLFLLLGSHTLKEELT